MLNTHQAITMSLVLVQPCRCVPQHYHGGGLPDDCHTLQLGGLSVCCQGCPLFCRPKLWLPAAAAGVPDNTGLRGTHTKEHQDMMNTHNTYRKKSALFFSVTCYRPTTSFILPVLTGCQESLVQRGKKKTCDITDL